MLLTEAKRSGLTVTSVTPVKGQSTPPPAPAPGSGVAVEANYTANQDFEIRSTGIYFQYVAFLDRVANLKKIIRVEDVTFAATTPATSKYVQLKSSLTLRTFVYLPTKADELGKLDGSAPSMPSNTPGMPGSPHSPQTGQAPRGAGA